MSENKVRYRSGNLTFNNKVLAFEHHYAYNTDKVSFEFANGTFDTCDFSQEPTESFDELCKQSQRSCYYPSYYPLQYGFHA